MTSSTTTPAETDPAWARRCRSGGSTTPCTTGLKPEEARYNLDYTGTGNSLNILHPRTMALVMDSLRYWVTDMHVDGFRFDLAPVLVRGYQGGPPSAFFEIIQTGPGALDGEADRRAVGRRSRRLPTGPVPARGGRSGTAPTATACAGSGGATRDMVPEVASRLTGSSDIYGLDRPANLRQRQLRHLSRRVHPHRSREL